MSALLCVLTPVVALAAELLIIDARIYRSPDDEVIERGAVLVRDGRIVEVGAGAAAAAGRDVQRIDAAGKTLLAGFWNSHVHLIPDRMQNAAQTPADELAAQMQEMFLRWGFTSVFDVSSVLDNTLHIRRRIESGEVLGPRILTVGDPFYPQGGTPVYIRDWNARHRAPSAEVSSAAEAQARAERQLARGADGVKLFTGAIVGGEEGVRLMSAEIASAAARPAQTHGAPVFAHPTTLAGLAVAVENGANVLTHTTPMAGAWSEQQVSELVRRNVALTPTLALFKLEMEKEGAPPDVRQQFIGAAQQQVRALLAQGGVVLFGTDVGFIEHSDPALEYQLMAQAGMSFRDILRALTAAPAERFRPAARTGRIAPGYEADLVLVYGDPGARIEDLSKVALTIRGGAVAYERGPSDAIARSH